MRPGKAALEAQYEDMSVYEEKEYLDGALHVGGIDEAGRGPLAGPVVAAACIVDRNKKLFGVNDSKKLSPSKREALYEIIVRDSLAWSVSSIDNLVIDEINILNATKQAMRNCLDALEIKPDVVLIDAVDLRDTGIRTVPIIRGDALSVSIAAASIIAKVTRDRIMTGFDLIYPGYGFAKHKGYGTKEHYAAIEKLGLTPIHRQTFIR